MGGHGPVGSRVAASACCPGPHLDWVAREVRWWRHWLDDDDNGVEADPAVEAFVQDSRRSDEHLLHRPEKWVGARFARPRGDGAAHRRTQRSRGDPSATGARHAGAGWCPDGDPGDFALDQRSEDADAATMDWPLVEDMRILGRPVADLRLTARGGDAQVVVRLYDVAPDGRSTLVAMGARTREGWRQSRRGRVDASDGVRRAQAGTRFGSRSRPATGRCCGRCLQAHPSRSIASAVG